MCSKINCSKCGLDKEKEFFRKRPSLKRGYQSWCKDCERLANKSRYIPKPKKGVVKKDNKLPEKIRQLKIRYNLSYEEYLGMYNKQNGKCLICEKEKVLGTKKGLYVDHCHTTGKVRGLLCSACNTTIGHIENNHSSLLKNIESYLTKNPH
jgi:hypothetical protein